MRRAQGRGLDPLTAPGAEGGFAVRRDAQPAADDDGATVERRDGDAGDARADARADAEHAPDDDAHARALCAGCRDAGLARCRLGVEYEIGDDRVVRGTVTFTRQWAGANDAAHGGFVAAVFDEVFGIACAANGGWSVTASLTVRYRRPVPLDVRLRVTAEQVSRDGRKRTISGSITDPVSGEPLCTADALFVDVTRTR